MSTCKEKDGLPPLILHVKQDILEQTASMLSLKEADPVAL